MSEFERKVRHALIDRGWTLTKLADELNITVSYLFEIMKGTRKAVEKKKELCVLLGIEDETDS